MSSINATRMKKGMLIKIGDDLFRVLELQHVTPGNLRGFVRAKFRNIRTQTLSDQKLRSEDTVERAILDEKQMQYLYKDGDDYHFMDTDSYEQFVLTADQLGDAVGYIVDGMTLDRTTYQDETIGVELPITVEMQVVHTEPGFAGDTQSGARKPATLPTGLVVQVPIFINEGDVIRVDTRTGEYQTRV